MPNKFETYKYDELLNMALNNRKMNPIRCLATYADSNNWEGNYYGKPTGGKSWVWKGPTFCAFELAKLCIEQVYSSLNSRINWPSKRYEHDIACTYKTDGFCDCGVDEWNCAIEACKQAYEEMIINGSED